MTINQKKFDKFLSKTCVKPSFVYLHPRLYKKYRKFWNWFLSFYGESKDA